MGFFLFPDAGRATPPAAEVYAFDTFDGSAERTRSAQPVLNAFFEGGVAAVAPTPATTGTVARFLHRGGGSQDPKDPVGPPMAAITPEQYNRIRRLSSTCGITPKLRSDIETDHQKDDLMGFNVVGEILWTTKADEWGRRFEAISTAGRAAPGRRMVRVRRVAMEALRILATCASWRHALCAALWGGEEENFTARWPMCNCTLRHATR